MKAWISVTVLAFGLALADPRLGSDAGYIYGRIQTRTGESYEGPLRWGDEEAFWDDIFNATKVENENLALIDPQVLERIRSRNWSRLDFVGMFDPALTHLFAVRFGDLKRLEVRDDEDLVAEFRNGQELQLKGGSNDVGAMITVVDQKLGRHEIKWKRIRKIEFKETPAKIEGKLGEPIFGSVKSGRYEFVGRIQWDHDETLTSDELDGETPDGKVHIPFGDISAIRKYSGGALVTLKSGKELHMKGTNDVNWQNRGIVVIVPRLGSVKIGWNDFDGARFSEAPDAGRGYSEFGKGSDLMGTVVTPKGRHEGRIVFDLDECWDFELLHGKNHSTEYLIAFRDIQRIRREGTRRSLVDLRMGLTIELEGSQDVSRRNDGLLVFEGAAKPRYIDWAEVNEVVFR